MQNLSEYVDGLSNICGSDQIIQSAIADKRNARVAPAENAVDFSRISSAAAIPCTCTNLSYRQAARNFQQPR